MAKKSSKKTFELKMLVPEENKPDTCVDFDCEYFNNNAS